MIALATIGITASDVSGQRRVSVRDIPVESTVGEVLDALTPRLHLDRLDQDGNPLQVEARLDREARALHRSELVRDALRPEDHLVLHPRVTAG
jgi:hypothetical protein